VNSGGQSLVRGLSLTSATALVIGTMIGTGVYFKAAVMAQLVGSPGLVLAAWFVAGALSLAGALTYAEMGAMLPQAGGEYIFLRTAYGPGAAFLCGWMRFFVASAGNAAAGVGAATFLSAIVPLSAVWMQRTFHLLGREVHWQLGSKEVTAVAIVLFFGSLNCLGVAFGGRVQSLMTSAKILSIAAIIIGAFCFSSSGSVAHFQAPSVTAHLGGFSAFGAAVLSALWACDGWAFMPMVAGEVRDPGRNVPRALIIGVLIVLALYGLANLAYFYALPFDQVTSSNSTAHREALPVAAKVVKTFLGERGGALVSVVFLISVVGALNGVLLAMARIPFAMARDHLFFAKFGVLNRGSSVPAWSVMMLSIWAAALALSGTFDQLTDMTVFSMWIFYALGAGALFVLRRKMPDAPRPYRTIGYPIVPLVFLLAAVLLVVNTLVASPVESVTGLVLIALGLPLYFYYRKARVTE
jgi:basic amino acid/polyamine antiporter, APA family